MITQADIGSSHQVDSPKYLSGAQQTRVRSDTADKSNNIDNFDLRKLHIKKDGIGYPTDSVLLNYEQNDYIEQYKDLKLFFREYFGDEILTPFISYPDMKSKNSIEVIDLRPQSDHIPPKKFQLIHEDGADPENAKFFLNINQTKRPRTDFRW